MAYDNRMVAQRRLYVVCEILHLAVPAMPFDTMKSIDEKQFIATASAPYKRALDLWDYHNLAQVHTVDMSRTHARTHRNRHIIYIMDVSLLFDDYRELNHAWMVVSSQPVK